MSRAVIHESFGGPEVLEVRDVPEPHAGPGELRVRVVVAGINPHDLRLASSAELGELFGYRVPSGFGTDFAGVVDEVGEGVDGFEIGDRVMGGARGRSVADYVVVSPERDLLGKIPEGVSDDAASTIPVAGRAATAVISAINVGYGDSFLVGGGAGGVGTFLVQLANIAGARVIATASAGTFGYLRELGVEPVAYGPGLVERVREIAPHGITAAADLFGREVVDAALELGVAVDRVCSVAPGSTIPPGVRAVGPWDTPPDAYEQITGAILAGKLHVRVAAVFPMEKIREAATMLAGRHVHGKIVVRL